VILLVVYLYCLVLVVAVRFALRARRVRK
jgi:hypothetical protein